MEKFNKELVATVEVLKAKRIIKKDVDIVISTGFSNTVVSNYLSGKIKASRNFIDKFEDVYKVKIFDNKIVNKEGLEDENTTTGEKAIETIHILASSNQVLVDNNAKIILQNDKIIDQQSETVKTNTALAVMLNAALDKIIVGSRQDAVEDVIARHPEALGFLADLGVPKLWKTREEGIAELGIRLAAEKLKRKKSGNVAGVSR